MITAEDLIKAGFHYSEYNDGWMHEDADVRFNLEDGIVDWFGNGTNFHGLTVVAIQDIPTLLVLWKFITGTQL